MKRRGDAGADLDLPEHVRRELGALTPEERTSLVDALHVALAGPHRRAGDADRWRGLLMRLGAVIPPGT